MKMPIKILAVLVSYSALAEPAGAREIYDFYSGIRQQAMGGAYTAVVNDETSLLTNPAGLGKLRDVIVTIANPSVQGSASDGQIINLGNVTSAPTQTPSQLLALLNQHPDLHYNALAQIFPSVVAPNVGFGVLGKYQYDAQVNSATQDFRLDYTNDYAAVLGFCLRFFGGVLKVGFDTRFVDRTEIHKDFPSTNPVIDMNSNASEGGGLGADTGIVLAIPVAGIPTFAAVVRDVGGTSYGLTNGMFLQTRSRPVLTPQTIDAGFAVFPIVANHVRLSLTADYKDCLNANQDSDVMKHVHVGGEANFTDFFFLRGGMNQGYWTGGIELSTERFQLQVTSFGEEIGTQAAPIEDRRFIAEFGIRF